MGKYKHPVLILVAFSACGGIHTDINMQVLTAYFPVRGLRESFKWVECSCLCVNLQLVGSSGADCQALT